MEKPTFSFVAAVKDAVTASSLAGRHGNDFFDGFHVGDVISDAGDGMVDCAHLG